MGHGHGGQWCSHGYIKSEVSIAMLLVRFLVANQKLN